LRPQEVAKSGLIAQIVNHQILSNVEKGTTSLAQNNFIDAMIAAQLL